MDNPANVSIDSQKLLKVSLFFGLDAESIEHVSPFLKTLKFPEETTILKEGDSGDNIYILSEGKVEISQTLVLKGHGQDFEDKDKTLIILDGTSMPVFGEMALLESSPRTATVRAIEDCTLYTINRDDFVELCRKHHWTGLVIMKNLAVLLSNRLRKANRDVLKLTTALSIVLK